MKPEAVQNIEKAVARILSPKYHLIWLLILSRRSGHALLLCQRDGLVKLSLSTDLSIDPEIEPLIRKYFAGHDGPKEDYTSATIGQREAARHLTFELFNKKKLIVRTCVNILNTVFRIPEDDDISCEFSHDGVDWLQ